MTTKATLVSAAHLAIAALVATGAVSACTPRPEGPAPAAGKFFAALATGDTATAADLSDNPSDAREVLNAAWAGLQATHLDTQILGSKYTEDIGSVSYRYTWHLPKDRTWTYDGQLKMARYEGRWQIRWSSTDLHPRLGEHQTFALRADPPRRAFKHLFYVRFSILTEAIGRARPHGRTCGRRRASPKRPRRLRRRPARPLAVERNHGSLTGRRKPARQRRTIFVRQ